MTVSDRGSARSHLGFPKRSATTGRGLPSIAERIGALVLARDVRAWIGSRRRSVPDCLTDVFPGTVPPGVAFLRG